jgi:GAF domain-containing protein
MTRLPVEALRLRAGASYEFIGGVYALRNAAGEVHALPSAFEQNDLLVLALKAERRPRTAYDLPQYEPWHSAVHLAVPMMARGELLGFAVFDSHVNGLEIDAEEIRLLDTLAKGCAIALDHIETHLLRRRVAQLERMLGTAPA